VVKADDRTAISQASASETDEPDESRMDSVEEDEKGNMNSPPETVTKPGSTLASSAVTRPGGETAGHKRKTEVGPTPPKTKKKKTKCGPSLGTTFKETEDNDLPGVVLVGVVLVQEQPYKIVLCIQINKVRQQLLLKLEEKAEADEDAPLFEESGIRHNKLHLSCSDAESYAWLKKKTADSMEIHGDNRDEVPKLLRAEVYISGPHVESIDLFDCSKSKINWCILINGLPSPRGGEGNLRPRRPPREYLGEYTS